MRINDLLNPHVKYVGHEWVCVLTRMINSYNELVTQVTMLKYICIGNDHVQNYYIYYGYDLDATNKYLWWCLWHYMRMVWWLC